MILTVFRLIAFTSRAIASAVSRIRMARACRWVKITLFSLDGFFEAQTMRAVCSTFATGGCLAFSFFVHMALLRASSRLM